MFDNPIFDEVNVDYKFKVLQTWLILTSQRLLTNKDKYFVQSGACWYLRPRRIYA